MDKPIELETERLYLRQWRRSDRGPFALLNADVAVMEHFPAPLDRGASDALAEHCEAGIRTRGWGLWAAEAKASGEFIGFVGLSVPGPELPCAPCVEIGWRLARAYWGQGLATEGAGACLRAGFELVALTEIVSFTALENVRSRRVMERLGMKPDAATFEHPNVPAGHRLREHCLYRISEAEWRRLAV